MIETSVLLDAFDSARARGGETVSFNGHVYRCKTQQAGYHLPPENAGCTVCGRCLIDADQGACKGAVEGRSGVSETPKPTCTAFYGVTRGAHDWSDDIGMHYPLQIPDSEVACRFCGQYRGKEDSRVTYRAADENSQRWVRLEYTYCVLPGIGPCEALISVDVKTRSGIEASAVWTVNDNGNARVGVTSEGCGPNVFDPASHWPIPPRASIREAADLARTNRVYPHE